MNSLPLGKHKTNASHEDLTLNNVNARMKQPECCAGENSSFSSKNEFYSHCYRDMSSMYHGTWPLDRNIWDAESPALLRMEVSSVMSFASSSGGVPLDQLLSTPDQSRRSSQQLEAKVDMVYSLLSLLGGKEHAEMGETLLALSISPESCLAMRQSGCLPLLVQLVQSDRDSDTRKKATEALHNLVESQPDEKARKREIKILRLLEIVTAYTEALENNTEFTCDNLPPDGDKHPVHVVSQIMKSSFDEGYRQAICQLGGIHSIAKLLEIDHTVHGNVTEETYCNLLRRYACMVLTNLTFGDSGNKALLCSYKDFIRTLLSQLQSPNDELRQVTAGVLRNLSWRADSTSKEILKEVGSVKSLMQAAMLDNKENTLISILSALWNLSAHCTENKSEICSVDGALVFLVRMLSYKSSSQTLTITENCGGILRNISSQIAGRDDYRNILRQNNCLQILVNHLKSTSFTIVSNACGTLWNLSSQNATDQELLWKLGAPSMLKNLNNSKHKMIAMGSSATLHNLLTAKAGQVLTQKDRLQYVEVRKSTNQVLLESIDANLPLDLSKKRTEKEFKEKSDDLKSSSSASLNIIEPTGSFLSENRTQNFPNCNGTSVPFVHSTKPGNSASCIPIRSKYSDHYEDELESSEEPFDFSRKYSETRPCDNTQKEKCSTPTSYDYEKPKNENENFSIYAETDLDQPTDYSLRYAENDTDSDSEVCENTEKTPAEFVVDTIKTYCTEGTPYETPFNFSTSTSMSDLRMSDKNTSDNDKNTGNDSKTKEVLCIEDHCARVQNSVTEAEPPQTSKMKSELSSGLMSPEKPMNYCDEGTPGYFSRVSSFGSLNSSPVCQIESKVSEERHKDNNQVLSPKIDKIQQKISSSEVKVVKFESNVNYCEETPLMFSRSSSLGSLDSIEQHSIQDDRSSVISDFSRLTSGIISPSELPDSPTQTIPTSPKPQKTSEFPILTRASGDGVSQISAAKVLPKSHIFEDNIKKFKEENTPIQYSMATSLSSLTIDDQDEAQIRGLVEESEIEDTSVNKASSIEEKENVSQKELDNPEFYRNLTRDGVSKKTRRQLDLTSSNLRLKSNCQNPPNPSLFKTNSCVSIVTLSPRILPPPLPVENIVQTYCTEDTPAILSHNGSISDLSLSTLSLLDEEPVMNKVYLSENSSQSSEIHESTQRRRLEVFQTRVQTDEPWSGKDHIEGSVSKICEEDIIIPPYTTATDEVSHFALEDSPIQFSERSSLSNLTIESSMTSEVKDFSIMKLIPEAGPRISRMESFHKQNVNTFMPNNISVIHSSFTNKHSESKEESAISPLRMNCVKVEERDSVDECQSICHSPEEENYTRLDQNLLTLEAKCGLVSLDSSLKKRRWKWKWKFGSDGEEQISTTENSSIKKEEVRSIKNEEVKVENSLYMLGSRSLDASYKKKKWWKWKFGTKEADQCQTVATEVPECGLLDIVPQDEQLTIQSEELDLCRNKGTQNSTPFDRKENLLFKSDIHRDTRNKSKRWKWKWKFSSKEGENSRSEELISLGLSKLKHSVSPVREKEPYITDDPSEHASLEKHRESRSTSVKLSSRRFSRSASEPRNGKKYSEETPAEEISRKPSASSVHYLKVEGVQADQTDDTYFKKMNNPSDFMRGSNRQSPVEQISYDGQINKSFPNNKLSMMNSECDTYSCRSSKFISSNNSPNNPDFAALVEECIQLGMPKKKKIPGETIVNTNESNAASVIRSSTLSSGGEICSNSFDHMAILEKCIQLCMPKKKDELLSNSEYTSDRAKDSLLNTQKERCDLVDPAIFDKCVELSKRMQRSKEKIINKISRALSLDKSKIPTADEYNTSSISIPSYRNMSAKTFISSHSLKCNEISKNDLEFLRRQLNIADKHLLQEAQERGISKEEEAFLIEILIMRRVMTEARQSEKQTKNYAVGLSSCSSKFPGFNESDSIKNNPMSYSEEPLDPVTLSIVKRILQHQFQEEYENIDGFSEDMEQYNTDLLDCVNSGSCNLEIVLEERIKVTLAKHESITNKTSICFNSEENTCATSSSEKSETPNSTHLVTPNSRQIDYNVQNDSNTLIQSNPLELSDNEVTENPSANITFENISKNFNSSNNNRDYAALVEECIQLGMPKKKKLSEENIYANISQVPGYSRCDSSMKYQTIAKTPSEPNVNSSPKTSLPNNAFSDAQALVEECIKMGMPKKKEEDITKNTQFRAKSNKETSEMPSISELNVKPDYKSLLEECIQLGMPKKNQAFSQVRSSPKPTNLPRSQLVSTPSSLERSQQNHKTSVENCDSTVLPKTEEDPEVAIYANISTTPGYSRLLPPNAMKSKTVQKSSCDKQQDFSTLINECIHLGMPTSKKLNIIEEKYDLNEISNKTPNYEALIEECIQLGMPKKRDVSEEVIYANTVESYSSLKTPPIMEPRFARSPRRMPRSDSEPGSTKIPFGNLENRSGSAFLPYCSSMDGALEEYIQLGWPKKKELVTDRKTIGPAALRDSLRIITVDRPKAPESKNVDVASVVRNTPEYLRTCFRTPAMATGAEEDSKLLGAIKMTELPDTEEIRLAKQERNGFNYMQFQYPLEQMNESIILDNETEGGSEMSFAGLGDVDAELLDPEAMLNALDKYTAELISQAELRLKLHNSSL